MQCRYAPARQVGRKEGSVIDALPAGTHTVILAIGDLNGIARGKRLQARRWEQVAHHGIALANAIFQMDMTCDVWDTPYGSMDNGYPDIHIVPVAGTLRPVPWEPGVVLTMCTSEEIGTHQPVPIDPRNALVAVVDSFQQEDLNPKIGVELEFYLLDPDTLLPRDKGIDVYGLLRGAMFEHILGPIRNLCTEFGVAVEVSNPEYAPGQFEVNICYDDALKSADNAVIFKHAVREIAWRNGMHATFMAKPLAAESGSGCHIHQSLWRDGRNLFSEAGKLSSLGRNYLGGLHFYMADMAVISAPNPNSMRRRKPYTFCPINNTWGYDNRTIGIRVIEVSESSTRIEQRDGSADCNPYLLVAAQLAAGKEGIDNQIDPGEPTLGNGYEVTDADSLPITVPDAVERFRKSALVEKFMDPMLANTLVQQAEREHEFVNGSGANFDEVTDVERTRYLSSF